MNRIEPKQGQRSAWDYPRPPGIEDCGKNIRVVFNGTEIVNTNKAKRVLETNHPPVYYIPPVVVKMEFLSPADNHTFCEWKGEANYFHLTIVDKTACYACWYYPNPVAKFAELKDYLAFYAQKMDAYYVGNEIVVPQPGKFYGGRITSDIVGPFKGEEGSDGW